MNTANATGNQSGAPRNPTSANPAAISRPTRPNSDGSDRRTTKLTGISFGAPPEGPASDGATTNGRMQWRRTAAWPGSSLGTPPMAVPLPWGHRPLGHGQRGGKSGESVGGISPRASRWVTAPTKPRSSESDPAPELVGPYVGEEFVVCGVLVGGDDRALGGLEPAAGAGPDLGHAV